VRVEAGQEPQSQYFGAEFVFVAGFVKVAVHTGTETAHIRAAAIVLGLDQDTGPLAGVVLAVAAPAGRRAQVQLPVAGPGDEAVGLHGHAVDGRQGGPDVQMMRGPVGVPRGAEHA
jgi:hypothetical protein